jgi:NMD protein affecting ribosome stability and mRNA decay
MDKVSEMTDIRHCEACGQVKFPSDHWQRKLAEQKEQMRVLEDEMLVMMDERNAAVSELEIYRQREADIFKSLTAVIT